MRAYFDAMRRYFDFRGRSTRAQYWQFVLVLMALGLAASVIDAILVDEPISGDAAGPALAIVGLVVVAMKVVHSGSSAEGWSVSQPQLLSPSPNEQPS